MSEYKVNISANIRSDDGISHFAIIESHKVEITQFAELDELMARMRNAIREEK